MSVLKTRPTVVWASLIVILGGVMAAGSLPFDISTRRTIFGLVAAGIVLVAALSTVLISQRAGRSIVLAACAVGFAVLLFSTRTLTQASQLPDAMLVAVLLAVIFTTLRTGDTAQDGWQPHQLFGALLIVLSPVWALYSIPTTFAHQLGQWSTAGIYLAIVWGVPIVGAWLVSRSKAATSRQLLLNVITGAISTLFTLGLIEGAIRITGLDQVDSRAYELWPKLIQHEPDTKKQPGDFVPNTTGEEQVLTFDLLGRSTARTVTYRINNAGFRGADFSVAKPPSTYRIALLGDSFAFGLGVQEDKIVSSLLGPMLSQATGCNVEVYNFGHPAYSTANEAAAFKDKALAYNPDMVVVWYYLNDPWVKGAPHFQNSFVTPDFFPIARDYSALAHLIGLRLSSAPLSDDLIGSYRQGYGLDDHRWLGVVSNLQIIEGLAKERKITPVLMVHPVLYELDDHYPFADIHTQVMQAADGMGFHSFDLFDAFKGQQAEALWVTPKDVHANEAGNAIAAKYTADKLKDLIPSCKSQSN